MNPTSLNKNAHSFIAMVCGSCITVLILLIMNKDYPLVGHDYRYFIPRLIDTDLHIQSNGLSIQWYTPSFGGGLPAFPNPQHLEYSIVQLLTTVLNPWSAILLSTAAISMVGYWYFYRFLTEHLELNKMASILGAMFFIGNGFYIEHLVAGLIGYQLFPLAAIILYELIDKHHHYFHNAVIIALILAMMIHQAGFYMIIILVLSFGMVLPMICLYMRSAINFRRILQISLAASVMFVALAASKVYAIYAFMRFFPRIVTDSFDVGHIQGGIGVAAQLFGVMSLEPFLLITHQNPEFLSGALSRISGHEYGIWETDAALSPVLILFLLIGFARSIASLPNLVRRRPNRLTVFSLLFLAFSVWASMEMTLAKGIIYTLTKQLPVLQSLHVNTRFAAAFIMPLVMLGAIELHRHLVLNPKPRVFWVLAVLTSLSVLSYFALSKIVYESDFSVTASNTLHEQIQNGMKFPVIDITDASIDYWLGFSGHASLYRPYEPIFGYELESFATEIHPGTIRDVSDGYFNMTNPASLVYPEINSLQPFERIKLADREKLETFLERGQPQWKIPLVQRFLDWVSVLMAVMSSGALLITSTIRNIILTTKEKLTS